jgi:signal transduction histidine kinase
MAPRRSLAGLDPRRLRLALALFFLALAVPAGLLVHQAYGQLKWEAFHQYRTLSEELATRIDGRIGRLIAKEESRSYADYGFLVVAGDPAANFLQPSPLSAFPVSSDIPGLVGYFQVDAKGDFSTPLVPASRSLAASYGISGPELVERRDLQDRILRILSRNHLVQEPRAADRKAKLGKADAGASERSTPASSGRLGTWSNVTGGEFSRSEARPALKDKAEAQAAFDRLDQIREEPTREKAAELAAAPEPRDGMGLKHQQALEEEGKGMPSRQAASTSWARGMRKERSFLPEQNRALPQDEQEEDAATAPALRVSIFESELDPFQLSLLDNGYFVLYRKVWRNGERSIQGALIEQGAFLRGTVEAAFRDTVLSRMSDLAVAYRGRVLAVFSARTGRDYLSSNVELKADPLYRTRLSTPASDLELLFSLDRLPPGPGARVLGWTTATLALVLCGGFLLMDRLGRKQIALTRQQQDFVSAVSHELKTPLTSIRMYAEMLREGWADEGRKRTYYAFICEESERLTRLINNVLQLARLTRNELRVDPKIATLGELTEGLRPKIDSLIDRAGFVLDLDCDACAELAIKVDEDFLAQILINLVDNAVKFARDAERKEVRIACRLPEPGQVQISVRDYGPGVPRDQMKKIFKLFYRSGNELTRETVGTGIGLALVRELTLAMGGYIDLVNAQPGAEFRLTFPSPVEVEVSKRRERSQRRF